MSNMWFIRGAVGGVLIGISASLLLVLNGRVTGISGILNALMRKAPAGEHAWRALFVAGLLAAGFLTMNFLGSSDNSPLPLPTALVAGALVGVGTRLSKGCTSGHGVCGLSRLSIRSLAATVTFIATGALAVFLTRDLGVGGTP